MSALLVLTIGLVATISVFVTGTRFTEKKLNVPLLSITATSTPTPRPTLKPTYKPQVKSARTYQTPIPTPDTDPIIECKSDLCNGGKMRLSKCTNSTCCGLGAAWYWYPSKEKCVEDQNKLAAQAAQPFKANPPPVYAPPTPALPTYNKITPPTFNYDYQAPQPNFKIEPPPSLDDYKKKLNEITEFKPTDYDTSWKLEMERLKEGLYQPPTVPTPNPYRTWDMRGPRTYEQDQLWGNP